MIEKERLHFVNAEEVDSQGECVVYWMQQSQRAEFNHALEYAILRANELKKPLLVVFALVENYPGANARHYFFMLQGLKEVAVRLKERRMELVGLWGNPQDVLPEFLKKIRCALLIADRGYLNIQRSWRKNLQEKLKLRMIEVESDVIVPVEVVSDREEFAARTIRPKIHRHLAKFLRPLKSEKLLYQSVGKDWGNQIDWESPEKLVAQLKIDRQLGAGFWWGGRSEAVKHLKDFLDHKVQHYDHDRNQPMVDALSNMSAYLHFGQISALEIVLRIQSATKKGLVPKEQADKYLEELIVRRELSMNFCHFNEGYDRYYRALPKWALATLEKHADDEREYLYTQEQWEKAQTHDPIWNACQNEMVQAGKMHGYMRMYWGKKLLEWTATPEEAFRIAIYLNDKYELDGREANGYAGIAWCFGKHDRPWGPERKVFGLVRYMNDAGIKRKVKNWQEYVAKWSEKML